MRRRKGLMGFSLIGVLLSRGELATLSILETGPSPRYPIRSDGQTAPLKHAAPSRDSGFVRWRRTDAEAERQFAWLAILLAFPAL